MSPTLMWSISHTGNKWQQMLDSLSPGHTAHVCQRQSWPWLYILASTPVSSLLLISCLQEWTLLLTVSMINALAWLLMSFLMWHPATQVSPVMRPPTSPGYSLLRWASLSLFCAPQVLSSSHAKFAIPYPVSFPTHSSTFYSNPTLPSTPLVTIPLAPTFLFSSPITY